MPRALGIIAAVLLVAACTNDGDNDALEDAIAATSSTAEAATTPTTDGGPTTTAETTPGDLDWSSCGGGIECATLTVPLDYDEPEGETIDLAVARRPADGDDPLGTVLMNPGGPGGSGVEILEAGFSLGGELDERFDLVSWDPRGVGGSHPMRCGEATLGPWIQQDPAPDDEGEVDALHEAAEDLADECAEVDGELLAHVGTADVVEDMDRLRAALGEEQISYLGLSYGTFLGQLYLEAHPDRVRAMVLDGVMDPADALPQLADAQAGGFETAFDAMADWCESSGDCAVDDPQAAYDEIAARVEDDPLPSPLGFDVGPAELQIGTEAALYSPDSWLDLADGLAEGLDGEGRILAYLAQSYYDSASFTAYAAVVCLDFGPPDRAGFDDLADELAERHPHFGEGLGYELLPCAYWPVPPVRTPAPVEHPDGAPPVLLVATLRDPATPIAEARDVADRLEGQLLEYDGDGHVAIHSDPCVDGWIEAYFLDGSLPDDGTTCP